MLRIALAPADRNRPWRVSGAEVAVVAVGVAVGDGFGRLAARIGGAPSADVGGRVTGDLIKIAQLRGGTGEIGDLVIRRFGGSR